ncbi:restriction endonuclease subunit S [Candidatus Thalassolituus haligoni]|uniref:restriction endonuclease subunit S n=1 Tax=Candidatus Thalassolituus haligoni TaxID=3100113 RepID=UPI003513DA10
MGYAAYSDTISSDQTWLGNIPASWSVKSLKFVGDAVIGLTYSPDDLTNVDSGTLVLRSSNIQNGQITNKDNTYVSTKIPEKLRTRVGDILICSRNGSKELIGKCGLITEDFSGSSFGAFTTVYRSPINHFLYYVFNSKIFEYQSGAYLTTTINQLTIGALNSFKVPLPPLPEQTQIARFLDYKTAQLDQLIAQKQALIERLNEQRIALITQAVTRGLNPDAALKDSGVEWLGQVPEGWEVKRLRFVIRSNPVKSEIRDLSDTDVVSFVPMEAVGEYGGIKLGQEKILEQVYAGYTYFKDDDVVVAKITPCFENGKGALARSLTNQVAFGTTELHVLRSEEEINPEWLFYLSISYPFREIGASEMYGAGGQKRVPEDFIKDFRIGIPGYEEQVEIVLYLNSELSKLDTLKSKTSDTITRLEEYRTTLITAAVTGKIDVRGFKLPEPATTPDT